MKCNAAGQEIIKRYEGMRLQHYLCPDGVWTIGYGHTGGVTKNSPPITEQGAEDLLRRDLAEVESRLLRTFSVPLNENQFSALVSLAFKIGTGALRTSTLQALANRKDFLGAADEFSKWGHAGGKKLAGLIERRKEERSLFLRPAIVT